MGQSKPFLEAVNFAVLRYLLKLEYFDFVYLYFPQVFFILFAYTFIVIESEKQIFRWQFNKPE